MHDGFIPSSTNISITRTEYNVLTKIRDKHKCLLAAIKNLKRFKVGYNDGHSLPSMLPDSNGDYINREELAELILTDEEISNRKRIRDIDEEIKRLNAEREKLSNGK